MLLSKTLLYSPSILLQTLLRSSQDPRSIVHNNIVTVGLVRALAAPAGRRPRVRQTDALLRAVPVVDDTRAVEQRTLVRDGRHSVHLVAAENG